MTDSVWEIHRLACACGRDTYEDPVSGYQVFTRVGLLARGRCCGAGCRHCPYAHASVELGERAERMQQPAWLSVVHPGTDQSVSLLFWSGGKDSYLAFRALRHESERSVVLVTNFDATTGVIAHQDLAIDVVVEQARYLEVPLIGVPLHAGRDYLDTLLPALEMVPACDTFVFGDLHLQHIRQWREATFSAHPRTAHISLHFPLWLADYEGLLDVLLRSEVHCRISAVADTRLDIRVGDTFDRELVARLPEAVDPFGENGEFHTQVVFA